MLVYERKDDFVMVEQSSHAILSADLFSQLRDDLLDPSHRSDVYFAIKYHDRAWIGIDAQPLWNDEKKAPYSFIDLPSPLKLPHYQCAVDWVERHSKYAGLLCSQHYASFFTHAKNHAEVEYYQHERERQLRLRIESGDVSEKENNKHLRMLKFFDNLSIYICINEPGASKDHEFGWYRDGFEGTDRLFDMDSGKIAARWLDEKSVGLTVFPFKQNADVSVPIKAVSKHAIQELGLAEAYRTAPSSIRTVQMSAVRSG